MNTLISLIAKIKGKKLFNVSLKKYTSFKIGGPADVLIFPQDINDLKEIISLSEKHEIPLRVIGRGTNLLVRDKGIRGIVISLESGFREINIFPPPAISLLQGINSDALNGRIGCGIFLPSLLNFLAHRRIGGLEFLIGIPGSLGGALVMNAGTKQGEIKNVLRRVKFINRAGEITFWESNQMKFGYRNSMFPPGTILLETDLLLIRREKNKLKQIRKRYLRERAAKQPLSQFSAGSIFKNPAGTNAGKLIEECGLKGLKSGDAFVSPKHANFIINQGRATAEEVISLIKKIKETVLRKTGIELETEIELWGEE